MAVPQPSFTDQGFVAPAESAILAGVTADIDAAFGGGMNPALNTPQGQLASSETAAIAAVNDVVLHALSQFDPQFATGRAQDALGRIYFLERNPAQPSTVQAQCLGALGVQINAFQQSFQDTAGNVWVCQASGTFTASGIQVLPFACLTGGPVALPTGSTARILNGTPGWDTVAIVQDAVPGTLVEGRAAFERRRALSVAINSLGWLPAIRGAVLAVPGVLDAFVTDNKLGAAALVGGVSLVGNSLYVCVAGGAPYAVAKAIFSRRPPGTNDNGNTTVAIQDTQSGYVTPYPTYSVTFQTAQPQDTVVSVVLQASPFVPNNAPALVQQAIVGAFAGTDGGPRAKIGVAVLQSRFYATISALGPWAQIVDILLGGVPTATTQFQGSISGNTLTVTQMGSGSAPIAVGQTVDDLTGSITTGTRIIGLGSGTGGTGTYTVGLSQTVSVETIYAFTATAFRVPCDIAHIPVVDPSNITVTLG